MVPFIAVQKLHMEFVKSVYMSKRSITWPFFIKADLLSPFVEKNTTLSKSDLIGRMAGKVKYEFLQLMKLLQFKEISKDDHGELSLF